MTFNACRIIKTLISLVLGSLALVSAAQVVSPYTIQPGSVMSLYWVYSGAFKEYRNKSLHAPANAARELKFAADQTLPASLLQQADAVANSTHRVTLTLIDKGQVVYRHHREGVTEDSFVISYSMAKSLTSLMVGHALCAGHIKNLDDKLGDYVPELADTAYGRASIRHVLNMASGADASGEHGQPSPGIDAALRSQQISYLDTLLKYKESKRRLFGALAPGEAFDYKNMDTAALTILLEKATQRPFQQWYQETLIPAAGLSRTTAWNLDKDNRALGHAFFYASPDDWLRLALYSLDVYKGRAGICMQGYLQQAVTKGVRVYNYSEHNSYGHQFWTGTPGVNSEVFWMRGHGGQYIGVDPKKERVLVAASSQPEPSVLALFRNWVNSN
jgi:CubicO group peptidase (beta-lactamase class C family)